MSLGPTSSKDEDVFPVGTHTKHTYTPNIYTVGHADHTQSTHMNTDSTNGLFLLLFLSGQDRSPLVRLDMCICIHTHIIESTYPGNS